MYVLGEETNGKCAVRATLSADGRSANIYLSTTINIVNGSINCDALKLGMTPAYPSGRSLAPLNGPQDMVGRGGSGDRDAFA
jgi:hypothetical protein